MSSTLDNVVASLERAAETFHDAGDLVRVLDKLANEMARDRQHRTASDAEKRSNAINGVLFSGVVTLDANGAWNKSFPTRYSAISIIDAVGNGPFEIGNDDSITEPSTVPVAGTGRQFAIDNTRTDVPLTGQELSVVSLQGTTVAFGHLGVVVWYRAPWDGAR